MLDTDFIKSYNTPQGGSMSKICKRIVLVAILVALVMPMSLILTACFGGEKPRPPEDEGITGMWQITDSSKELYLTLLQHYIEHAATISADDDIRYLIHVATEYAYETIYVEKLFLYYDTLWADESKGEGWFRFNQALVITQTNQFWIYFPARLIHEDDPILTAVFEDVWGDGNYMFFKGFEVEWNFEMTTLVNSDIPAELTIENIRSVLANERFFEAVHPGINKLAEGEFKDVDEMLDALEAFMFETYVSEGEEVIKILDEGTNMFLLFLKDDMFLMPEVSAKLLLEIYGTEINIGASRPTFPNLPGEEANAPGPIEPSPDVPSWMEIVTELFDTLPSGGAFIRMQYELVGNQIVLKNFDKEVEINIAEDVSITINLSDVLGFSIDGDTISMQLSLTEELKEMLIEELVSAGLVGLESLEDIPTLIRGMILLGLLPSFVGEILNLVDSVVDFRNGTVTIAQFQRVA